VVLAVATGAEVVKPESVESEIDKAMKKQAPPADDTRNLLCQLSTESLLHY